jgi:hypothetical protein
MSNHDVLTQAKAMFMSQEARGGCIVVEIETEDKQPVNAKTFGELIVNTVECLEAIADSTLTAEERPHYGVSIIEANIIGDRASFTVMGYDPMKAKAEPPK